MWKQRSNYNMWNKLCPLSTLKAVVCFETIHPFVHFTILVVQQSLYRCDLVIKKLSKIWSKTTLKEQFYGETADFVSELYTWTPPRERAKLRKSVLFRILGWMGFLMRCPCLCVEIYRSPKMEQNHLCE